MFLDSVAGSPASDSLKHYLGAFDKSLSWDTVSPLVEEAELEHIRPAFGDELVDDLLTKKAASGLGAEEAVLVGKIQRAVAHFTRFGYLKQMGVRLSNMGPVETVSTDNTAVMPRQWVQRAALKDAFMSAHIWLDKALQYADQKADGTIFSEWTGSAGYLRAKGDFFATPEELSGHLPNIINRIVFLRLQPAIRQAQDRYLRPMLGQDFYTELKDALADQVANPLDAANQIIVEKCRATLANWAMAKALPHLQLEVSENNVVSPAFDDGIDRKAAASSQQLSAAWVDLSEAADEYGRDLISYLNRNADSYPTWKASAYYVPPVTDEAEIEAPRPDDPVVF